MATAALQPAPNAAGVPRAPSPRVPGIRWAQGEVPSREQSGSREASARGITAPKERGRVERDCCWSINPTVSFSSALGGRTRRASGRRLIPSGRYGAIFLHSASAACLIEAMGMCAAAVRQVCLALRSAALTVGLLVVI